MKKLVLLTGFLLFSFSAFSDCIDVANLATSHCDVRQPECFALWEAAYLQCLEGDD